MKKLLLCLSLLSGLNFHAQLNKCATDRVLKEYLQEDPQLSQRMREQESLVREWISAHRNDISAKRNTVVKIPVVFHIVYKNAAQNIPDSNIFRQIDILNACYRAQNSNMGQTRPVFDTLAADVEVEFCLASYDPQGNPTNGIIRKSAPSNAAFDPLFNMDKVKSSTTNGSDPWNTSDYLNIWVCDMSFFGVPVVLGYATFPGSDPLKDGVVIQYNFIGYQSNGTSNNLGRTTVHEVGHWLGMRHIWGDGQQSGTVCDSTDYVDDTPNADTASQQTCLVKNSCSNESPYWTNAGIDPPDMIENYMDYSYDACMTMFTRGQKDRMLGFLNTTRSSLLVSQGGCNVNSVATENDAENTFTIFPNPSQGTFSIRLKNFNPGIKTIVSLVNVLGETVFWAELTSSVTNIELPETESGVYLLSVKSAHEKSSKKVLIGSK
jgi:hypothetical protein